MPYCAAASPIKPGSRLFAAVHHAQWLAVVSVLSANGLTPNSPGVDKNEALTPALTTAVAAAGVLCVYSTADSRPDPSLAKLSV